MKQAEHIPLGSVDGFILEDFVARWRSARRSALELEETHESAQLAEHQLLALVPEAARNATLRRAFDNSRKLALSASRRFNVCFGIEDFKQILIASGIPCARGHWNARNAALVTSSQGCTVPSDSGSFACDFFRESIDGLVMGAGDSERFARHGAIGHGDDRCIDVYYDDSTRTAAWDDVPAPVATRLSPLIAQIAAKGGNLRLQGYAAGTLFYSLTIDASPQCGSTSKNLHEQVREGIRGHFPHLRLQDTSPLAVYGDSIRQ